MEQSSSRKTSSGFPLILHYGELYNYFIIYHSVIIIEIKCTINVMPLNHPQTIPPSPPPPAATPCSPTPRPSPNQSLEKLSSRKPDPVAKKIRDCWFRGLPLCSSICVFPRKLVVRTSHELKIFHWNISYRAPYISCGTTSRGS